MGLADRGVGAFALVVASDAGIRLALRANWRQFALLVVVNAFVGATVGLERAILPVLGEQEFGLASRAALLTFIASFGATKALTNLAAGALADRVGRRRLLIAGWLFGLPVPVLIILAPGWEWVVAAVTTASAVLTSFAAEPGSEGRMFGAALGAQMLGWGLGPLVGAAVTATLGVFVLYLFAGAMMVVVAVQSLVAPQWFPGPGARFVTSSTSEPV